MEKQKNMKKSYAPLSMTPLSVALECDILAGSIKVAKQVTVEQYQDGFEGIIGAEKGLGDNYFSEIEF